MSLRPTAPLLLAIAAACSPKVPTWEEVRPPEAYLGTLPAGALVQVNGEEVGRTPLSFAVRDVKASYRIRATKPGFSALERVVGGEKLANGRLDLVLRPEGFGTDRLLDLGEPVGLVQAAAALVQARHPREALEFVEASLAVADTPAAHRVAGQARWQLGDRHRAVQEFSVYLMMEPQAPDRVAIERAIEAARRDMTIAPLKTD